MAGRGRNWALATTELPPPVQFLAALARDLVGAETEVFPTVSWVTAKGLTLTAGCTSAPVGRYGFERPPLTPSASGLSHFFLALWGTVRPRNTGRPPAGNGEQKKAIREISGWRVGGPKRAAWEGLALLRRASAMQ
jgi:hypothetical protein